MSRKLSEVDISAIIEMALSDDVSFSAIKEQYGINEESVKKLMKKSITDNSYKKEDTIFSKMDYTNTSMGKIYLKDIMKNPIDAVKVL